MSSQTPVPVPFLLNLIFLLLKKTIWALILVCFSLGVSGKMTDIQHNVIRQDNIRMFINTDQHGAVSYVNYSTHGLSLP
ncbi:hypothetical protein LIPSTDRAFT_226732 [Lipomyces starkeyi NRRL Y-11557]|uniref:Uncharacterized protein n=1 Tax=Lipomyces starkeyi NRRL Y-11557 TaxID=675824 RepID=A0A1E3QCE0_LIPST|nr:hypothetical protein LIPSTDRAFT_226732 [Lipomyces starkeyi NRRL Y-11557]